MHGGLIVPSKDIKEKTSRLMRRLGRSKSDNVMTQSQHLSVLVSLLETMRVQMELNMLEGGAHKSSCYRIGESGRKANELRVLLAKIEESEQRCKGQCLKSLREIAMPLAERPARGDLTGEVCHWADGYHLNVKLYVNLLLSVFDVLDEGKLTELKKFWSFLSPYGVIWESRKPPSTTLAMLGYYFNSSLSGFCLDFLVAAQVGTRMEEVAVSSARLVPVRCPQQVIGSMSRPDCFLLIIVGKQYLFSLGDYSDLVWV
ncbi:hypothetical protein H5410_012385 [Solanum commersonii]|uniref:Uncharacterized protein n=1 Tax=Solanum commersonii TaxID=4109 RepID=A0A9J6ASQ0_SOLCO|nr:hypothetical protein H5410_012385 [Solanum commersonii]